jgi:large subunit ribosomal protein L18
MITPMNRSGERRRIHRRIRQKISGNADRPRLCVYRSSKYVYVQIVDDVQGKTLVSASTAEKDVRGELKQTGNIQASKVVGKAIAERAKAKGIETVVFDRGGYRD